MTKELIDTEGKKHLMSDDELKLTDLYNMTDIFKPEEKAFIHKITFERYTKDFIAMIMGDLMLPPEKISLSEFIRWSIKKSLSVKENEKEEKKHFPCHECWRDLLNGKKVKNLNHTHSQNQELLLKSLNWGF